MQEKMRMGKVDRGLCIKHDGGGGGVSVVIFSSSSSHFHCLLGKGRI